jgi:Uma2 family endonuclease
MQSTSFREDFSMATNINRLLTIADWEAMPDDGNRYEIIEGELFVSSSPGLTHQIVLGNLLFLIRRYLESTPVGVTVLTPGLILNEISGVIPDLVFFRHQTGEEIISGERLNGPPDLVIEILSPGSANTRRDRVAKFQLYAKHGVPEYWIVDPLKQVLEVHRLETGSYKLDATLRNDAELSSSVLSGFTCPVSEIFRR